MRMRQGVCAALAAVLAVLPAMAQGGGGGGGGRGGNRGGGGVNGAVVEITADSITVQGRAFGNRPAPPAQKLALNDKTAYAAAAAGAVADLAVGNCVLAIADADGNSKAIGNYKPAAGAEAAGTKLVGALGMVLRMRAMGGQPPAQGAPRPQTVAGVVTAIDGAKITIKGAEKTTTVTLADGATVLTVSDKKHDDIVKDANVSIAASGPAEARVADAVILLPAVPRNN